ncbi:EipB family protein [Aurantimonas coralicida]|uniref:EipB family protein n=1 Tax=Aurantimonas coralicida TaxID=182270 RepID=UPI001E390588|nr:DUF1849 family protein [Aurantimonas coralicida]MCD1645120.1 cell envelope integrity EipB family protein [Aurantimonas coralicida]
MARDRSRSARILMMIATGLFAFPAKAADIMPHLAVYDMSMLRKSSDLVGGSGRIALKLERETCEQIELDYRFVARFEREDATVVTDQQTVSVENFAARAYDFTTRTFVDNVEAWVIRGSATNTDTRTRVEIAEPSAETFDLPLSVFPSAHTMDLIDRAIAGESFVETRLYDGDNEAGKLLTTTAIITPVQGEATPPAPANPDGSPSLVTAMRDMRRWRVAESYYNSDSKLDGLPLFQTSYILYENGVSDDIMIDNGDYAFSGSLSKLELASAPDCRNRS